MHLVRCCVFLLICGRIKPRWIFMYLFFCKLFQWPKRCDASSPIVIALRAVSPNYIPSLRPNLGWLLCPPIHWKPSKCKTPSLSLIFFSSLYSTPVNDRWMSSPTCSVQSHLLSNSPPTAETAFLDLPFLTIFVGIIVYADKRTGWIRYDLFDW